MNVKVQGGTAEHGVPSLCLSCRNGVHVKGPRVSDVVTHCRAIPYRPAQVTFPVTSCSDYDDRSKPSLWKMEEIAWVLRSDPTRNRIGFVHAKDLSHEERHVLDD
jgi:hypothetical protein